MAAGKKATANAEVITIYGGNGSDVFNLAPLGTGDATITLGGTTNRVVAGGGGAMVRSTAALASAAVVGTSS